MQTVTSTDLQMKTLLFLRQAQQAPLSIQHDGAPQAVLIGSDLFSDLIDGKMAHRVDQEQDFLSPEVSSQYLDSLLRYA